MDAESGSAVVEAFPIGECAIGAGSGIRAIHQARRMTEFSAQGTLRLGESELAQVVLEPRSGGRWFERGVDGSECQWGRVAAWDPPRKVVLLWQIGADWQFDPEFETEVEVTFSEEGPDRSRLDLRHCNLQRYGANTEQMRAIFDDPAGWTGTLAGFVDLAAAQTTPGY